MPAPGEARVRAAVPEPAVPEPPTVRVPEPSPTVSEPPLTTVPLCRATSFPLPARVTLSPFSVAPGARERVEFVVSV